MATNLQQELYDVINRNNDIPLTVVKKVVLEFYLFKKNHKALLDKLNESFDIEKYTHLVKELNIISNLFSYEEDVTKYVNHSNVYPVYEAIIRKLMTYQDEEIKDYLVNDQLSESHYDNSPQSLIEFVIHLFGDKVKGKNLLDICSGNGSFLAKAKEHRLASKYYGVEINRDSYLLSLVKMNVEQGHDYRIINGNAFYPFDILTNQSKIKFGGVFSNFPFNIKARDQEFENLAESYQTINDLPLQSRNTGDYRFISLMLRNLDKHGRAIAVTAGSALFNSIDQELRKYMIEKGLIEAVIELPERLFYHTGIKTYLLVMSFGNKAIKFVDLFDCVNAKNRITNELDVDKAMIRINSQNDSKYVTVIPLDEIDQQRFSLVPANYLSNKKIKIIDGQNLGEVCEVFSGWQVTSSQLDELFVANPEKNASVTQIVQMSDVNDGVIRRNTKLYQVDDKQLKRFSLIDGDVVISTKSAKVKSAVVEIKDGEHLIASGSIMVLRANKENLDPYYLRAFLDSPIGQQLLALKQTGNVIPNLTVNNVKTLQVPVIPLERQRQISKQYIDKLNKLAFEKKRLERLQEDIDSIFDFVSSGEEDAE